MRPLNLDSRRRLSPHGLLRNNSDCALRAYDQRATFRKRAYRVEGIALFLLAVDPARIVGRAEVEDEVLANNEQALRIDWTSRQLLANPFRWRFLFVLANGRCIHPLIVCHRREECLRM